MQVEPSRTLAGTRVFADLDEAERRRLEGRCTWRRYRPGETVLERGSESREVLFIVQGAVNIVDVSLSGREVAYATLMAGDCFGELSAIDGQPRSASVVATENTLLAVLSSSEFLEILKERAEVSFKVLERLTSMVRMGDIRIMELSTLAATQRVYAEILRMAAPDAAVPDLWVIRPLPPLREIASRVSTTRETVARALSQLYPTGLVRRKGKSLYIVDRDKLEEKLAALQREGGGHHHI
ncbi:MAG: Crp/Fnr family transcriptional regulator [Gammaproteobacteria bacterium]|nr:Crp/Fnr family transcriptional regulator [Gammaproteobacteria bacterium]